MGVLTTGKFTLGSCGAARYIPASKHVSVLSMFPGFTFMLVPPAAEFLARLKLGLLASSSVPANMAIQINKTKVTTLLVVDVTTVCDWLTLKYTLSAKPGLGVAGPNDIGVCAR